MFRSIWHIMFRLSGSSCHSAFGMAGVATNCVNSQKCSRPKLVVEEALTIVLCVLLLLVG
jgi:hypothetical protein